MDRQVHDRRPNGTNAECGRKGGKKGGPKGGRARAEKLSPARRRAIAKKAAAASAKVRSKKAAERRKAENTADTVKKGK